MNMKTHELIEMAGLDAMGLLDDDERDAFDLAFRGAPPAVQAMVRREQARIARDESLLPQVDPPMGLKARVLAAWRDAVQAVAARRHVAGRILPSLMPSRGVSPIWRAAAIGCAAAALVFGFATLTIRSDFERVIDENQNIAWGEAFLKRFGATFERDFYDPAVRRVTFAPVAADAGPFDGKVALMLDESGGGRLYCTDMPAGDGAEYRLVLMDRSGNIVKDIICTIKRATDQTQVFSSQVDGIDVGDGVLGVVAVSQKSGAITPVLRGSL